jgi:hypothetical protein
VTNFQSKSSKQGKQFEEQCVETLLEYGYKILKQRVKISQIGVEIDTVAISPKGSTIFFEFKGSYMGQRPGLMRTDTLKKAIANGALLKEYDCEASYVVIGSHLPKKGAGLAMLKTAISCGYIYKVINLYDPNSKELLRQL